LLQSYDISRPNAYICAMDDNNDTQHLNTVQNFEFGVTKRVSMENPCHTWWLRVLEAETCRLEMLPVSSNKVSCND